MSNLLLLTLWKPLALRNKEKNEKEKKKKTLDEVLTEGEGDFDEFTL